MGKLEKEFERLIGLKKIYKKIIEIKPFLIINESIKEKKLNDFTV